MGAMFQRNGEKDLFGQPEIPDKKTRKKTGFVLPEIKKNITLSYENVIFLFIGFTMSCIIFFSLGVEKGKRDVDIVGRVGAQEHKSIRAEEKKTEEKIEEDKTQVRSAYIIQLAAFRGKDSAEEEEARLKKEGYNAAVRRSGDYYQVYIGGFDARKDAEGLLTKLKKKYNDCYIIKY